MIILGIETSCDETAISVVRAEGEIDSPVFEVLGSSVQSQIDIHKEYGGVFPTLAKREHIRNLPAVLIEALRKANLISNFHPPSSADEFSISNESQKAEEAWKDFFDKLPKVDVDMIAVTVGPGLEPALWTGIKFAENLGKSWGKAVIPTNHMIGHIASVLFGKPGETSTLKVQFPALALLVSGGHTELVLIENWWTMRKLGETLDDAVGEAFDKVARMLGLPYPGGPEISRLAGEAREKDISFNKKFPRPMINSKDYNFSFSGLKTAVLYYLRDLTSPPTIDPLPFGIPSLDQGEGSKGGVSFQTKLAVAREFEDAAIETLISKTRNALLEFTPKTLIVGGGVVANKHLRQCLNLLQNQFPNTRLLLPERELSTDNATMIAGAAYINSLTQTKRDAPLGTSLKADGNLDIN